VSRFENVFEHRQDYRSFVDILKDASEMWPCGQSGFRIEKYRYVSSIIKRVKRQVHEDAGFRKRIDALSPNPTKSQGQT
jgi:hypothetical protein